MKLMPDYACEPPLWGVDWWRLSLSSALLNDLADWQQAFDDDFDPMTGWRSDLAAEAWAEAGTALATRLEDELGGRFQLAVDLWPIEAAE